MFHFQLTSSERFAHQLEITVEMTTTLGTKFKCRSFPDNLQDANISVSIVNDATKSVALPERVVFFGLTEAENPPRNKAALFLELDRFLT